MDSITQIVFYIAVLVFSIVIHEVAHGYAALFRGDPTAKYAKRLTLNLLKHLELFGSLIVPFVTYTLGGFLFGWAKPVPYNPHNLRYPRFDEAFIAIAGPVSNMVIALISAVTFRALYVPGVEQSTAVLSLLSTTVILNVALALFNLVPIPPLDGSKILFSLLPYRLVSQYRHFIETYSIVIFVAFIFLFSSPLSKVTIWFVERLLGF